MGIIVKGTYKVFLLWNDQNVFELHAIRSSQMVVFTACMVILMPKQDTCIIQKNHRITFKGREWIGESLKDQHQGLGVCFMDNQQQKGKVFLWPLTTASNISRHIL